MVKKEIVAFAKEVSKLLAPQGLKAEYTSANRNSIKIVRDDSRFWQIRSIRDIIVHITAYYERACEHPEELPRLLTEDAPESMRKAVYGLMLAGGPEEQIAFCKKIYEEEMKDE